MGPLHREHHWRLGGKRWGAFEKAQSPFFIACLERRGGGNGGKRRVNADLHTVVVGVADKRGVAAIRQILK